MLPAIAPPDFGNALLSCGIRCVRRRLSRAAAAAADTAESAVLFHDRHSAIKVDTVQVENSECGSGIVSEVDTRNCYFVSSSSE